MAEEPQQLFREEALEHYQNHGADGRVLQIDPGWTRWSYWVLVGAVLSALLFCVVGTLHEYATGTAVVRLDAATELTAPTECTVSDVLVRPGERVSAGAPLVRFYLAREEAELARVEGEYQGMLVRLLRDPTDQTARSELTTLIAQRELARSRIAQRSVLAPHAGVVTGVRVRPGQALSPGDPIATLATESVNGRVLALVPAQYRPMLRPGMVMRLELVGFRFAYQALEVDLVGDEAVGPAEVKRFLGPDSADTVTVTGPVVLVQAKLPKMTFTASGESFQYYDGMLGSADVRVRTRSILVELIPGLEDLLWGKSG